MSLTDESQIRCKFTTKLPAKYRIAATEIAVPANLTRYGLSQIVNHLLALEENVPLDFLVNGQLVRLPLGKHLLIESISAESLLEIEYIFAVTPPQETQQILHDDWVAAINGCDTKHIISGSYDGMLSFWSGNGQKVGQIQAHRGPITALNYLGQKRKPMLLSAGKLDHTVRLMQIPKDPAQLGSGGGKCLASFKGHSGSVLDIAASPSCDQFVSSSQDKSLRIWPLGPEATGLEPQASEGQPAKKKQKSAIGVPMLADGNAVGHVAELKAHTDAVTCTLWLQHNAIQSGSMDHTVRKWDAETGTNVDTFHAKRAIYCIGGSVASPNLTAFAGAGKAVQLWDSRQKFQETSVSVNLISHSSHIHSLAWHLSSEYHLASASMDHTCKLWDIRSSIPLHTLEGHTEQVLCIAWWDSGRKIVSGSADKSIRIYDTKL